MCSRQSYFSFCCMKINEDGISRWRKRLLTLCTRFQHKYQPEHQCSGSQPSKRLFSLLTAVSCCSPGSYTELRQGPPGVADRHCVCCFFSPRASDSYGPHFWGPWIPAYPQEDCHWGDFTTTLSGSLNPCMHIRRLSFGRFYRNRLFITDCLQPLQELWP